MRGSCMGACARELQGGMRAGAAGGRVRGSCRGAGARELQGGTGAAGGQVRGSCVEADSGAFGGRGSALGWVRSALSFFGMQPTFTHVPPMPQVVPCGDGRTKSHSPTRAPSLAASLAHARPPDPPPMTKTS